MTVEEAALADLTELPFLPSPFSDRSLSIDVGETVARLPVCVSRIFLKNHFLQKVDNIMYVCMYVCIQIDRLNIFRGRSGHSGHGFFALPDAVDAVFRRAKRKMSVFIERAWLDGSAVVSLRNA